MGTVFIFHGTAGYPQENWFPWLKGELEKRGCRVFVPQFPTPENQSLQNWFKVAEEYRKELEEAPVLVGHSLGGTFLLRLLESGTKARAAFLVAAPIGITPVKNYGSDLDFVRGGFDWKKIRENCGAFAVFHSDNDPLVPLRNGEELAKNLGVELSFVPGCGHFNSAAGFDKFDMLLRKMEGDL